VVIYVDRTLKDYDVGRGEGAGVYTSPEDDFSLQREELSELARVAEKIAGIKMISPEFTVTVSVS
jgi:hypothetical protein